MKTYNIAIVGLGNIGLEVYKNLLKNKKIYLIRPVSKLMFLMFVQKILKNRGVSIPKKIWMANPLDLPKIKNIDIIVELIGGSDGIAKKLVFASIKKWQTLRNCK